MRGAETLGPRQRAVFRCLPSGLFWYLPSNRVRGPTCQQVLRLSESSALCLCIYRFFFVNFTFKNKINFLSFQGPLSLKFKIPLTIKKRLIPKRQKVRTALDVLQQFVMTFIQWGYAFIHTLPRLPHGSSRILDGAHASLLLFFLLPLHAFYTLTFPTFFFLLGRTELPIFRCSRRSRDRASGWETAGRTGRLYSHRLRRLRSQVRRQLPGWKKEIRIRVAVKMPGTHLTGLPGLVRLLWEETVPRETSLSVR